MDKKQATRFLAITEDFDPVTMALTDLTFELDDEDAKSLRRGIGEIMLRIIDLKQQIYNDHPDLDPDSV